MRSLVLDLQQAAMNADARVSDILRKAVVVATKLRIETFKTWAEAEFRGYSDEPIPPYRNVRGQLRARNPYHGWIPVILEDAQLAKKLSQRDIGQPISELEELYHRGGNSDTLQVPLPNEWLLKVFAHTPEFQLGIVPTLLVGRAEVFGILEAVRNEVLRWSLELERQGILGEGMTFSPEEVQRAATITYNIQSFTGVLGDVTAAQLQIGDYGAIHTQLKQLGIPQDERNELENIFDELRCSGPEQKPSLLKRGAAWLARNGSSLGALSETIRGWFESFR